MPRINGASFCKKEKMIKWLTNFKNKVLKLLHMRIKSGNEGIKYSMEIISAVFVSNNSSGKNYKLYYC